MNKKIVLLLCLMSTQLRAQTNQPPNEDATKKPSPLSPTTEDYERRRKEDFDRYASLRAIRDLFFTNWFSAEGGIIANFKNDGFYAFDLHLLWFGMEYFRYIPMNRTILTSGDDLQYNLSGIGFKFSPFTLGSWVNKETLDHKLNKSDYNGLSLSPYLSVRLIDWSNNTNPIKESVTVPAFGLKLTLRNSAFRFSVRTEYIVSPIKIYSGFMAGMVIGIGN